MDEPVDDGAADQRHRRRVRNTRLGVLFALLLVIGLVVLAKVWGGDDNPPCAPAGVPPGVEVEEVCSGS